MKKILKKIVKTFLLSIGGLLLLVALVIGGLNIMKFAIYNEYYSLEKAICRNPGLNDGFVCQGLSAYEDEINGDRMFVSGYMMDKTASRIYVTDLFNNSYYVSLNKANGKPYKGHAGGISNDGKNVYLVSDDCIFTLEVSSLLNAKKGDILTLSEPISLYDQGSFCFSDGEYLYTGEFHDGNQYITNHPVQVDENTTYHAIVAKYHLSDLNTPIKIYSIRDNVQGFAIREDGKILLSTSCGLNSSNFYVYDDKDAFYSGTTLYDAPLYYLTDVIDEFKGPAMSEGVDVYKGQFITCYESACNKYIFGKFFFANDIVSLTIQ